MNSNMVSKLSFFLILCPVFGDEISFHMIKTTSSETLCTLFCHKAQKRLSLLYTRENVEGNCILKSNFGQKLPLSKGFTKHYAVLANHYQNVVYQPVQNSNMEEEAFNAGFHYWIVVNGAKLYLARESQPTEFIEAILQCFLKGGVLPMESSDEFIDAMSSLTNDSVTPRFTSLTREFTEANGIRHLTWTLGPKEWGEDEKGMDNPKFQDWPEINYDSYLFQVDPKKKRYNPSSINDMTNLHHCQYVGKNLATKKAVTSSSQLSFKWGKERAVDGILRNTYWIAELHHRYQPDWISVDLGGLCAIEVVMWIARINFRTERNKDVQVWVGNTFLASHSLWRTVNFQTINYCGVHPYSTPNSILSGVTCESVVTGQYVTLVNFDWQDAGIPMQFGEIGIFGTPLLNASI